MTSVQAVQKVHNSSDNGVISTFQLLYHADSIHSFRLKFNYC